MSCELVVDLARASSAGMPCRPALARAGLRELAQMRGRPFHRPAPARADIRSAARRARSSRARRSSPFRPAARVDRAARAARARAGAVRHWDAAASPASRQRDAVTHRGERILQRGAARARACARRRPRSAAGRCAAPELAAARQPLAIAAVAHELHRDPGAAREVLRQPFALRRPSSASSAGSHSASVPSPRFVSRGARHRPGIPRRRRA